MTNDEAQAEAVRRWGPDAQTEPYQKDYVQILIGEPRATWKGWPPRILVAWGKTWEETFANADAGQYKIPERYHDHTCAGTQCQ